jgi:hypothetical protein
MQLRRASTLPTLVVAFLVLAALERASARDQMPLFDPRPSCRSVAAFGLTNERRETDCLTDEEQARDELKKRWFEFSAASRTECTREIQIGGPPSCVELLVCLEIAYNLTADNGRRGRAATRPLLPGRHPPRHGLGRRCRRRR